MKNIEMKFSCIVDMPVELGISEVLKMEAFEAGGLTDYEEKARVAAKSNENTKCNICSSQRTRRIWS